MDAKVQFLEDQLDMMTKEKREADEQSLVHQRQVQ
jgi:hypothetical protein